MELSNARTDLRIKNWNKKFFLKLRGSSIPCDDVFHFNAGNLTSIDAPAIFRVLILWIHFNSLNFSRDCMPAESRRSNDEVWRKEVTFGVIMLLLMQHLGAISAKPFNCNVSLLQASAAAFVSYCVSAANWKKTLIHLLFKIKMKHTFITITSYKRQCHRYDGEIPFDLCCQ